MGNGKFAITANTPGRKYESDTEQNAARLTGEGAVLELPILKTINSAESSRTLCFLEFLTIECVDFWMNTIVNEVLGSGPSTPA